MTEKQLRQKFVNMAMSYIGVKEGSSKHKYIVDTYNKIKPLPQNYKVTYQDAWCATFVSSIACMCDMQEIFALECSCNRQIDLWKQMGKWIEDDSYVPEIGMPIYYDWDDSGKGDNKGSSEHVGIVVSVNNGKIEVVEGNYSNSVKVRTLAVNGRYIRGFANPEFALIATKEEVVSVNKPSSKEMCNVELNILKKGSKGNSVKALQALLVGFGYNIGSSGIDGDFGKSTLSAVKKYQTKNGLEVDGVVGSATWTSLLK